MKKLKHKHYYDEVYAVNFVFLLNVSTDKEVENLLKKKYPHTHKVYMEVKNKGENVSIENSGGKNIQSVHREIIMVKKYPSSNAHFYGVLAHECLHAALDVFKKRGVEVDLHTYNEHLTYYTEMLVRIALEK